MNQEQEGETPLSFGADYIADSLNDKINNAQDAKDFCEDAAKIFYETQLMDGKMRYLSANIKFSRVDPEVTVNLRQGLLIKGAGATTREEAQLDQDTKMYLKNAAYRKYQDYMGGDE